MTVKKLALMALACVMVLALGVSAITLDTAEAANEVIAVEEAALQATNVAKVGDTEYATIDEAIAAWTNGKTLTLLADVQLSDVIKVKSTEHHILNLGTFTMTAAEGKNAFEIIASGTGDAERGCITFNADAANPGGIKAGKKAIVYYDYSKGTTTGNDRPIIYINGGVFDGSTSTFAIGSNVPGFYAKGTAARKCVTFNITGGTFNCTILGTGKSKMLISGGTFNYSVSSQGDQTCYRLISGGRFKTLGFMTADSNNTKFWIGTAMAKSDVGVYVDDNDYLVVGGPVITEFNDSFKAYAKPGNTWSTYLKYSSAMENGLYYENANLAANDTKKGLLVLKESATAKDEVRLEDALEIKLDSGVTYSGTVDIQTRTLTVVTDKVENFKADVKTSSKGYYIEYNVKEVKGSGYVITYKSVKILPTEGYEASVTSNGTTTFYPTLDMAIDKAVEGSTVTLLTDIKYELDASTYTGKYGDDDAAVIIDADKSFTLDLNGKAISVKATLPEGATTAHSGAIINHGNLTVNDTSAEGTGKIVFEYVGVYDNGYKRHGAIMNFGTLTVNGGTIENVTEMSNQQAIDTTNYNHNDAAVIINGGLIKSAGFFAIDQIGYDDFALAKKNDITINGGVIEGGIFARVQGNTDLSLNITDGVIKSDYYSAVYYREYYAGNEHEISLTGGTYYGADGVDVINYTAHSASVEAEGFISGGEYAGDVSEYVAEGFKAVGDNAGMWRIFPDSRVVETISVVFKNRSATENDVTYDIVLKANDADIINRLNSVDLSFVLDNDDMAYEILATNDEVVINPVTEGRYEFHYDGKDDDVDTDKANEIKIGSVKFTGYGVFTFEVNADADETNAAHATKMVDNLVDTFVQNGSTKGFGDLLVNTDIDNDNKGTISDEIKVPTRALTVNVDFPNAVLKKAAAYQAMKVTVSGGDLAEAIVVNLGNEGFETAITTEFEKNEAKYAVELTDGYKVTFANVLTVNTTYNITVEGAGYRTSRYSVTMTKDKTVNFWNNVKDNDTVVEEGKYSEKKNFLAGDIVADNNINIYDLSAVVSYFTKINDTSAYSDYAKYDLNRDGKIDSKDVAYVLVSWGE